MTITVPNKFGRFGGKFVPETLMEALEELEESLASALTDETFIQEYTEILQNY